MVGLEHPRQQPQQARLAASVRADHSEFVARIDAQRRVLQEGPFAPRQRQVTGVEERAVRFGRGGAERQRRFFGGRHRRHVVETREAALETPPRRKRGLRPYPGLEGTFFVGGAVCLPQPAREHVRRLRPVAAIPAPVARHQTVPQVQRPGTHRV